jgi:hypothetical protein
MEEERTRRLRRGARGGRRVVNRTDRRLYSGGLGPRRDSGRLVIVTSNGSSIRRNWTGGQMTPERVKERGRVARKGN